MLFSNNVLLNCQYYYVADGKNGFFGWFYYLGMEWNMKIKAIHSLSKYNFLLAQLVQRDFKTRYRRSILGILWSLLNPLLIMVVQYLVFSTLFRFDIPNYSVYLLSGIVIFNYMTEATSQSMTCIIQNASLINKVYVPKFIYPFSRVLSSGVNFLFRY